MLSKSDYTDGLECPKRLWLSYHMPETKAAPTPTALQRMQAGTAIGKLAQGRFPNGVNVGSYGKTNVEAAQLTATVMSSGATTIFEATFVHGQLVARVDVLNREGDGWRIIEVKSSSKYKKADHLPDVAFQAHVLTQCGHSLVGASLMHLNGAYVWQGGDWDLNNLFEVEDITADVLSAMNGVDQKAASFLALAENQDYPPVDGTPPYFDPMVQSACSGCAFVGHCKPRVPSDHVYYLGLFHKRLKKLLGEGIRSIGDVQASIPNSAAERLRYRAFKSGHAAVADGLRERLAEITYPAYFLDFETLRPDLPLFKGHRPYMMLPFQWSCHVLGSNPVANLDHSNVQHIEFLHDTPTDPREAFVESLLALLENGCSVVHYHGYEKNVIDELARDGVAGAELLQAKFDRFIDLRKIVEEFYADPGFMGKTSIKNVLPIVAPGLTYSSLNIQNGDQAQLEYAKLLKGELSLNEAAQLTVDLRAYCKMDTWAMVEVLRALVVAS